MSDETNTKSVKSTANKQDDPEVVVKILVNGALINDAHHALGKTLKMPESKARVLMKLTPPQVEIIGV